MLVVLHHLLATDQMPFDAILEQLRDISRRWATIE
jgi:hypothetical protein